MLAGLSLFADIAFNKLLEINKTISKVCRQSLCLDIFVQGD